MLMVLVFSGCEKPSLPIVSSTGISNITGKTALGGGNVTSDGGGSIISRGVCWHTSENPTLANYITSDGTCTGEFSSNIAELAEGTTYHVRAYATNSKGTAYGEDLTFTTKSKPVLTTLPVLNITGTTAESGGKVIFDGGSAISERGICWSTSIFPTVSDHKTTDGTGNDSFVSDLSGLAGNATYYVRAYATNGIGTGYGDQITFTTNTPVPILTTTAISSIMSHTCYTGGNIVSDRSYPVTEFGVCWSTSRHPTTEDRRTSDGNGIGTFSTVLKSLSQNTTYYARAYATNSNGTAYGNEFQFTTASSPTQFNSSLTYGSVTDIDGNVYKTITIGEQDWMAENLRTTKYQNGDIIGTTPLPDTDISNEISPKYQWVFDANESNLLTYGRLYTWYAATDSRKVCPAGWHVPSDAEWLALANFLGDHRVAGNKLKETGTNHWFSSNTGTTNETGFSAIPGGYRIFFGTFYGIGLNSTWWTSSESTTTTAKRWNTDHDITGIARDGHMKSFGVSIRCLKD